jgi:hypothetical protein
MWSFQITAAVGAKAEKFMEIVEAWDVVIEEWTYHVIANPEEERPYLCGFGTTYHPPKQLEVIACKLDVALVYCESEQEIEERIQSILQEAIKHDYSQS